MTIPENNGLESTRDVDAANSNNELDEVSDQDEAIITLFDK